MFSTFVDSSWTKVTSVILTLGAIAGVFWAADQHWVNFPFHKQTSDLTLNAAVMRSNDYAKQLDIDNNIKLKEFASIIQSMQREQQIQTAQNQVVFLMKQEMSMKEAMAKLRSANKPINLDFQNKLNEVIKERETAEIELKNLMSKK